MPLLWLSLAFLFGILLAPSLGFPTSSWFYLSAAGLLLIIPPIYRRWVRLLTPSIPRLNQRLKISSLALYPLCLVFLSIGAIRYQLAQPLVNPSFLAYYNEQPDEIILEALVVDPPDERDSYTNLRLGVDQLRSVKDDHFTTVHGLLLATVSPGTTLRYGDRVRLQGKLDTPPEAEDFSYRDYLAHQSIYSTMSFPEIDLLQHGEGNPVFSVLYAFREHSLDVIYQFFPDPEASLIAGIILGVQAGIPEQVQEAFRLTGTSHIIVISG